MVQAIKEREYIENFLEFVRTFLVTEDVTIREINLVRRNLDILKERIELFGDKTVVKGSINAAKEFKDDRY